MINKHNEEMQKLYELCQTKWRELHRALLLETDTAQRFKIKEEIKELEERLEMFKQHLGEQGQSVVKEKPIQASLPKSEASKPEKTSRSGLSSVFFVGLVVSGSVYAVLYGSMNKPATAPAVAVNSQPIKSVVAPPPAKKTTEIVETFTDVPEMVKIPAGSFIMGSEDYNSEKPVHKVRIENPFYMSKYEITLKEFRTFIKESGHQVASSDKCSWNSGMFAEDDNQPVQCVSWHDAVAYADWLSQKTGKNYRLPTEAEWEYAARGGSTGKWYFGNEESQLKDYAWYWENSDKKTHPVGEKKPNAYGLYDMAGNVWEWTCSDYSGYGSGKEQACSEKTGNYKSLRGGSWYHYSDYARSANRNDSAPSNVSNNVGFRLVLLSP